MCLGLGATMQVLLGSDGLTLTLSLTLTLPLTLTLQVLLGSDGRGGDPLALDRVQMAALVSTAAKFGAACETVERFSEMDVAQPAFATTDTDGDGLLRLD